MDQIMKYLLPYLPPDAQALLLHPPALTSPQSFLPLIRLAWPLARWFVVIFAFWIVWSTLAGVFGYFSRFVRFAMKIGPVVGLIAMVMSQSGQGSLEDVLGAVRQWAGAGVGNNNARGAGLGQGIPGLEGLQGLFTGAGSSATKRNTRSKRKQASAASDPLANVWSDVADAAQNGDLQNVVQDYVKAAVGKASGLGWLFDAVAGAGATEDQKKQQQQQRKRR